MTLKEYRHIYDKVSLSKEADDRILQALTEENPDYLMKQTLTEAISDSVVAQKKQKKKVWITRIAKIAGMAAMITIPILAVEMMRLFAVTPTEGNVGRKGKYLMKEAYKGIEFGYPISEYSYESKDYEGNDIVMFVDLPEYENADDLVNAADLIFSGTVIGSTDLLLDTRTGLETDSDTDGMPYTMIFIVVDQVYKGSIDGRNILLDKSIFSRISSDVNHPVILQIRRLGWQTKHAGYDLSGMMKDAPEINIDTKYLFLAKTYDDVSCPELVNLTQSVYSMEDNQGEEADGDDKDSEQDITLSDILEGALERKVLEKKEYPNGISIEGEAWSQKIDDASEEEIESKSEEQSKEQAGIGFGGQAGTPSKSNTP